MKPQTCHVLTLMFACALAAAPPAQASDTCPVSGQPHEIGQWSDFAYDWPEYREHAVLLHTGHILAPSDSGDLLPPVLFDPSNQTDPVSSPLPDPPGQPPHALTCSGHAALPDGRVLLIGGHPGSDGGVQNTTIFDPNLVDTSNRPAIVCNGCWFEATLSPAKRWYPTCTLLGDGRVLAMAGWREEQSDNLANRAMIYPRAGPVDRAPKGRVLSTARISVPGAEL